MNNQPKLPIVVFMGCLVATVMGLPGVVERAFAGMPEAPQQIPWGLWIAAYTFFSGISAGAFAVVALAHVFDYRRFRPLVPFALLAALVALIGAIAFVLADLGHPERSFHIFLEPNFGSVMAWVITLYNAYALVLVVMLWAVLRPHWARQAKATGKLLPRILAGGYRAPEGPPHRDSLSLKILAIVGLVCALGLGGGVGALFSVLGGRALWHSGLFPITFILSALLSGLSFVLGGATLLGRGGDAFKGTLLILGRLIGYLLIVELVILPAEALVIVNGAIPSHLSVLEAIGAGPFPWVFWGMQVGVGMLAALLLFFLPRRPSLAAYSVASLFVLVGVFAFRLNFVIPQLAMGDLAVTEGWGNYMPHLEEWPLVVFGVGLSGLLLLVGRRLLPVFSSNAPMDFELAARAAWRPWTGLLRHQQEWR